MVSNALSRQVITARSSLECAIKLRRAWDVFIMVSSRCWVSRRLGSSMLARQAIWGQGASSLSNIIVVCWSEEGAGRGLSERYCSSLTVQFGLVALSSNGHHCFILASMASMSASNLSIKTTSLQDEGRGGERYCVLPFKNCHLDWSS